MQSRGKKNKKTKKQDDTPRKIRGAEKVRMKREKTRMTQPDAVVFARNYTDEDREKFAAEQDAKREAAEEKEAADRAAGLLVDEEDPA